MKTRVVRVDPQRPDPAVLAEVGAAIRRGELVAFPTETVYGLGADALDDRAVRRIFEAKGRPPDNPLIVHVASPEQAMALAYPDPRGRWEELARRFWPGPLTLILPCRPVVSPAATAGLDTVAIRMPAHPVALGLIRAAGRPIAAPSANRSGRPSPSTAQHVVEDLYGRVEWILDGGPTGVGVESTVLDLTDDPPAVLRPGGVGPERLEAVLGPVRLHAGEAPEGQAPRSPGMKYRHYAPETPLLVLEGSPRAVAWAVRRRLESLGPEAGPLGLFVTDETLAWLHRWGALPHPRVRVVPAGPRHDLEGIARRLFGALRELDQGPRGLILAEAVEERGLGVAVNNRLRRAAAGRVERCAEPP
ncbi:MAG TPA: L-threonylcarbamoyladenylate synthase [Limnochordales bacterium]